MASRESFLQRVRRYAFDGWDILRHRGLRALMGAAALELATLVDKSHGPYLVPANVGRQWRRFLDDYGVRGTLGSILRGLSTHFAPPVNASQNPVNLALVAEAQRHDFTYELTLKDGVVPSRRPVNDMDFALEVPFASPAAAHKARKLAVMIHCFYPDVLQPLIESLNNIEQDFDLFLSTDSEDKHRDILSQLENWSRGKLDVRIVPNRGRDIAAKFIGFADVYCNYELVLHLHTKKSPHGGSVLSHWRDHLVENLLGSPQIVRSILSLFDDEHLGVVFPQHLFGIRGILNWGYNYDLARDLAGRIGVKLDKNLPLEFPSGSIFWARTAALKPLLDLHLAFEDFPEEAGQVDGTLAHALERIILISAESAGYEWLKVVQRAFYPLPETVLSVSTRDDIARHRLKVFQPVLGHVDSLVAPYGGSLRDCVALRAYPSRNRKPRLNLIINTINPQQSFGGVATALKCFGAWCDALGEGFDRRIIVTDAEILPEAYAAFPDYAAIPFLPSLDDAPRTIIDAYNRAGGGIDLRADDIFVATAWWTEPLAQDLDEHRGRWFGLRRRHIYLIQDDEPHFQGWSSRFVLAEKTYRAAANTIAVINSEELYTSMTSRYEFGASFCIPYQLNGRLAESLSPAPRERTILVYARPSVARNAFEIIANALHRWQQADPVRASRWHIIMLGEAFDDAFVFPLQNVTIGGKESLAGYAGYLNRASVGISLMISPHPSYPPLEMAEAGLEVVTNSFGERDPRSRFPGVHVPETLDVRSVAQAIEQAVAAAEPRIGKTGARARGLALPLPGPIADPAAIAGIIRDAITTGQSS